MGFLPETSVAYRVAFLLAAFALPAAWTPLAQAEQFHGQVTLDGTPSEPQSAFYLDFEGDAAKAMYEKMMTLKTPRYVANPGAYAIEANQLWCIHFEAGRYRDVAIYRCGTGVYGNGTFIATSPVMIGVID